MGFDPISNRKFLKQELGTLSSLFQVRSKQMTGEGNFEAAHHWAVSGRLGPAYTTPNKLFLFFHFWS